MPSDHYVWRWKNALILSHTFENTCFDLGPNSENSVIINWHPKTVHHISQLFASYCLMDSRWRASCHAWHFSSRSWQFLTTCFPTDDHSDTNVTSSKTHCALEHLIGWFLVSQKQVIWAFYEPSEEWSEMLSRDPVNIHLFHLLIHFPSTAAASKKVFISSSFTALWSFASWIAAFLALFMLPPSDSLPHFELLNSMSGISSYSSLFRVFWLHVGSEILFACKMPLSANRNSDVDPIT